MQPLNYALHHDLPLESAFVESIIREGLSVSATDVFFKVLVLLVEAASIRLQRKADVDTKTDAAAKSTGR
jgi:hypothetical protein